jgi:hypothetical protein
MSDYPEKAPCIDCGKDTNLRVRQEPNEKKPLCFVCAIMRENKKYRRNTNEKRRV